MRGLINATGLADGRKRSRMRPGLMLQPWDALSVRGDITTSNLWHGTSIAPRGSSTPKARRGSPVPSTAPWAPGDHQHCFAVSVPPIRTHLSHGICFGICL